MSSTEASVTISETCGRCGKYWLWQIWSRCIYFMSSRKSSMCTMSSLSCSCPQKIVVTPPPPSQIIWCMNIYCMHLAYWIGPYNNSAPLINGVYELEVVAKSLPAGVLCHVCCHHLPYVCSLISYILLTNFNKRVDLSIHALFIFYL